MVTYTCVGSVRGECGREHRALRAAVQCCRKDHRGCASQGGYSDRAVVAVEDGKTRRLTEYEYEQSLSS